MNHDDVFPTRGAIRTRGSGFAAPAAPIRTRGAVRTRGGAGEAVAVEPLPVVAAWIGDLRRESSDIPLTIVVHSWETPNAARFLDLLRPHLWREDAIWLVPGSSPGGDVEGAVILDMQHDVDRRTYHNMTAEIVFFGAEEASEAERVHVWQGNAKCLVVCESGPARDFVLRAAEVAGAGNKRYLFR